MGKWYFASGGKQQGPVSIEQLQSLIASGKLLSADLVWTESMSNWTPVGQVPELAVAAPAPAPPTAAPAAPRPRVMTAAPAPAYEPSAMAVATAPAPASEAWPLSYEGPSSAAMVMTQAAMQSLAGTSGWVRFVAVLHFVYAGFIGLALVFMLIAVVAAPRGGPQVMVLMVPYAIGGAIVLFLGIFLNRYASGIQQTLSMRRSQDLEAALEAQRTYWRLLGIVILVTLVITVLLVVGMMIFGFAMASRF